MSRSSDGSSKLLAGLLALVAGSTDAISFLGLGGLFSAHITGNLVVLAASAVHQATAPLAALLSIPVFMAVVVLTRLFATACGAFELPTLRPLLVLQALLLAAFLALRVSAGLHADPQSGLAVLAGMFAISAMAVQNALVQIALKGVSATAVMTMNVTRLGLQLAELLAESNPGRRREARIGADRTWPQIAGFVVGCAIGASAEAAFSVWSAVLPATLAVLAVAFGFSRFGQTTS